MNIIKKFLGKPSNITQVRSKTGTQTPKLQSETSTGKSGIRVVKVLKQPEAQKLHTKLTRDTQLTFMEKVFGQTKATKRRIQNAKAGIVREITKLGLKDKDIPKYLLEALKGAASLKKKQADQLLGVLKFQRQKKDWENYSKLSSKALETYLKAREKGSLSDNEFLQLFRRLTSLDKSQYKDRLLKRVLDKNIQRILSEPQFEAIKKEFEGNKDFQTELTRLLSERLPIAIEENTQLKEMRKKGKNVQSSIENFLLSDDNLQAIAREA